MHLVFQSSSARSYMKAVNEQEAFEIANDVCTRYGSDIWAFLEDTLNMLEASEKSRLKDPIAWEERRETFRRIMKKLYSRQGL